MKKCLSFLLVVLLLAGCTAAPAATEPIETLQPTVSEIQAEPKASQPQLYKVTDVNSVGYYSTMAGDDGWWGICLDFAAGEEKRIDPPETIRGERRMGTLLADDTYLYWIWSDFYTTTPKLIRTDLDGQNAVGVTMPQGWYLSGRNGIYRAGDCVYLKGGEISDNPNRQDEKRLLCADFANDTVTTVTGWDELGGSLIGIWQDKLLLTRNVLDAYSPERPQIKNYQITNMAHLRPYMTTSLYALDLVAEEETELQSEKDSNLFDARFYYDGSFWHVENDQLLYRLADSNTDIAVAELPGEMSLDGVYEEDIMLRADGTVDKEKQILYVYDRASRALTQSPQRYIYHGASYGPDILCQTAPGRYLIRTQTSVMRTATWGGETSTFEGVEYGYALTDRAALLDTSVPTYPIALQEWHID